MTANELGNAAGDALDRKGTCAEAGDGTTFSRSALARIWSGQERLRQKMRSRTSTSAAHRNG
ncbi:hypothetical protein [Thioalkalivibrio versutus]|uniref:hypothetical protein n=1 Tax=Thioalkalivibrio versutus TaxID=106634 RepID=UPI00036596B5|nr:hypothetical protein [Thioalkalivibrio versutus]OOC51169.1 hypothetical protein B0684_01045 [Thioalkalivibrio versutus]